MIRRNNMLTILEISIAILEGFVLAFAALFALYLIGVILMLTETETEEEDEEF
jgi:hypothetical protein